MHKFFAQTTLTSSHTLWQPSRTSRCGCCSAMGLLEARSSNTMTSLKHMPAPRVPAHTYARAHASVANELGLVKPARC